MSPFLLNLRIKLITRKPKCRIRGLEVSIPASDLWGREGRGTGDCPITNVQGVTWSCLLNETLRKHSWTERFRQLLGGKHINVLDWRRAWRGHVSSLPALLCLPLPCHMHLFHLTLPVLYPNKTVVIIIELSWVLGIILSKYQTWEEGGHGESCILSQLGSSSRVPATCNQYLKWGRSWGPEPLTYGVCVNSVSLTTELNWIVGHPVGIRDKTVVGKKPYRLTN